MLGYVVSLFGPREIENLRELEAKLERVLSDIIKGNDFVTFLIGRNGDFDECAASCIKRIQRRVGSDRCELVLVIPYIMANVEYYEKYYDSVIVPDKIYKAHPKGAISKRNKWMVSHSNEVWYL